MWETAGVPACPADARLLGETCVATQGPLAGPEES
ncbi:hypothetical protein LAUMK191_05419 [Mycobacterium attenuatum]|uniref:Uncharacterized protein n=1 Tax=Mycobacterium attenuatum TaxID=2341086 RepID=A0A498QGN4_9MYCO|nr:hypothetical protein LAUMK136_05462 [Mycobacterium attenuatum]VBA60254.1 hypothetical protein LAUMK191_05419 [Mycobacterium attenuatum]